ncbi:metallophosphoesterase family protein [Rhizobium lusitanum]|uniref:metallophosphoesterase family protein n=1 Tax=Rhizobium lusitanum TaxID=293958 RepID=UPI001609FD30|nr:metallophosphoesterase family protein [Rhizobium lusitanum]QND47869.1 metallophosphoesterase family protein [Rhizobium lusitanum]
MRFAVIADIHGNHLALEAVLADIRAQGIDDIVNLGDCLSGPLTAGRTADILLGLHAVTVRGNHDRYLIESPADAMPSWEQIAFSQLSPAHLDWLRTLPFSTIYKDEAYLCHATPTNDNVYWLETVSPDGHICLKSLEEIETFAAGIDFPLILCGHSHIPRAVRLSDGRLIVNPGSVGCPAYDDDLPHYHKVEAGHPFASYAIMDKIDGIWVPTFRQVAYDHRAMAELAAQNGRADWASGLATGWLR